MVMIKFFFSFSFSFSFFFFSGYLRLDSTLTFNSISSPPSLCKQLTLLKNYYLATYYYKDSLSLRFYFYMKWSISFKGSRSELSPSRLTIR